MKPLPPNGFNWSDWDDRAWRMVDHWVREELFDLVDDRADLDLSDDVREGNGSHTHHNLRDTIFFDLMEEP